MKEKKKKARGRAQIEEQERCDEEKAKRAETGKRKATNREKKRKETKKRDKGGSSERVLSELDLELLFEFAVLDHVLELCTPHKNKSGSNQNVSNYGSSAACIRGLRSRTPLRLHLLCVVRARAHLRS